MRRDRGGLSGVALLVGLVALCCGGPLLIGALLATGVAAWLLASGGLALAGIALLVAAILGSVWLRRTGWSVPRAADADRCAPSTRSPKRVRR